MVRTNDRNFKGNFAGGSISHLINISADDNALSFGVEETLVTSPKITISKLYTKYKNDAELYNLILITNKMGSYLFKDSKPEVQSSVTSWNASALTGFAIAQACQQNGILS